ncbi:MAG: flagellar basal-body rod protein FlgG [Sandaracinaceae bacterium]|nr:MAG: flagellar basal-body rod protein FlgG [Sandaracinaceae bacterium]HBQ20127.1 flagellar basal body rod protein FlgG [Myxococcales bacterium]
MMRSLRSAASGMVAQQTHIDTIANNMANVSTTGFRRSRAEFQDLLYQQVRTPGGRTADGGTLPTGVQIGQGTRTVSTEFMHTQGAMQQTGNPLDLAIEGEGFFQIVRPGGDIAYTRAGNLKLDNQGQLVTVDGLPIEPQISVPQDATSVSIAQDGTVSVTQPGSNQTMELGQLQIARFPNPGGLQALGRSMFQATSASGQPLVVQPGQEGSGTLSQGFLEGSNVEVVNEMIDLISSQRAYELNQRVIQASDEMLRKSTEV